MSENELVRRLTLFSEQHSQTRNVWTEVVIQDDFVWILLANAKPNKMFPRFHPVLSKAGENTSSNLETNEERMWYPVVILKLYIDAKFPTGFKWKLDQLVTDRKRCNGC